MREHSTTALYNTAIKVNKCNFCRGKAIRYGKRHCKKGIYQLYLCKSCGRRFSANTTFKKMKNRADIIVASLDLYFKGLSLRKVCDFVRQQYGIKITHPTVLCWLRKYIKLVKAYTDSLKIVPSSFNADETILLYRKHKHYVWDIIDRKSRFLLALKLTRYRYVSEYDNAFKDSLKLVKGQPRIIFTDGFPGYRKLTAENYPESQHIASSLQEKKINMIERFNGTLKERYKIFRGSLKSLPSAQILLDGFRIYYNFIRSNMALSGLTPAQVAGLNVGNNWMTLIQKASKVENNENRI